MDEFFCPHCQAILNDQPGFDPDNGVWECTECGMTLMSEEYAGTTDTAWYCDSCNTFLNRQSGFSDSYAFWRCTECGSPTPIAASSSDTCCTCPECGEILNNQFGFYNYSDDWECADCGARLHRNYSSDPFEVAEDDGRFTCPHCGATLKDQSYYSEYDDDWECTECGTHLHRNYSSDPYEVVEDNGRYSCPSCGATLKTQPGYSEYDDDWECTDCGAHLHRNYSSDPYEIIDTRLKCPHCDAVLEDQSGYSATQKYWVCAECETPLQHSGSDDEFETVDFDYIDDSCDYDFDSGYSLSCPQCRAILVRQCDYDDSHAYWVCTKCKTLMHHDFDNDPYTIVGTYGHGYAEEHSRYSPADDDEEADDEAEEVTSTTSSSSSSTAYRSTPRAPYSAPSPASAYTQATTSSQWSTPYTERHSPPSPSTTTREKPKRRIFFSIMFWVMLLITLMPTCGTIDAALNKHSLEYLPAIVFFGIFTVMFKVLSKSPRNHKNIFGKRFFPRKWIFVLACVLGALPIASHVDTMVPHLERVVFSLFEKEISYTIEVPSEKPIAATEIYEASGFQYYVDAENHAIICGSVDPSWHMSIPADLDGIDRKSVV